MSVVSSLSFLCKWTVFRHSRPQRLTRSRARQRTKYGTYTIIVFLFAPSRFPLSVLHVLLLACVLFIDVCVCICICVCMWANACNAAGCDGTSCNQYAVGPRRGPATSLRETCLYVTRIHTSICSYFILSVFGITHLKFFSFILLLLTSLLFVTIQISRCLMPRAAKLLRINLKAES